MSSGTLYLVPSLLSDNNPNVIPPETKAILFSLQQFIVENEKTARRFLKAVGYPHPLSSVKMTVLDEHTGEKEIKPLLSPLLGGIHTGLISEAGCPAVADPGSALIRLAHQQAVHVKPLTGPSSILLALMASGLNGQSFSFVGYLPRDKDGRVKALKALENVIMKTGQTQIFIETPYRNKALMYDILHHIAPHLQLCIASSLTSPQEFVQTKHIREWPRHLPHIDKQPAVFLLGL